LKSKKADTGMDTSIYPYLVGMGMGKKFDTCWISV